jgi:hypothetical protein
MDGVRTRPDPCGDHGRCVEEVERIRTVGVGDDRADPQPVARSPDAGRDLATIGDEEGPDRPCGPFQDVDVACHAKRDKRVIRDTPTPADPSRREAPARDPALDGARRRPEALRGLARAQLIGHVVSRLSQTAASGGRACQRGEEPRDPEGHDVGDRQGVLLEPMEEPIAARSSERRQWAEGGGQVVPPGSRDRIPSHAIDHASDSR